MVNSSYLQSRRESYNFNMTTSSGDKISISSYHNLDMKQTSNSISLREEFGLSFSYKGDGIDAQDKKEIDKAMKQIKPLLDIFKLGSGFKADNHNIANKAFDINSLLPTPKDDNHKNFIKDSLIDIIDEMLKAFDANDKVISLAKNLFDAIEEQMEGFNLYA